MGLDQSGYVRGLRDVERETDRRTREMDRSIRDRLQRGWHGVERGLRAVGVVGTASLTGMTLAARAYAEASERGARETEKLHQSWKKFQVDAGRDLSVLNLTGEASSRLGELGRLRQGATDGLMSLFGVDMADIRGSLRGEEERARQLRSFSQGQTLDRSIRSFGAEGSSDAQLLRQVEIDRLAAANEQLKQAINNARDLAVNEKQVLQERRQAAYETRLARIEAKRDFSGIERNEDIESLQRRRERIGLEGIEGLDAAERQAIEDAEIARRRARREVEGMDGPEYKKKRELIKRELEIDVRRDSEIERIRRQREGLGNTSRNIGVGAQIDILRATGRDNEADALSLGLETQTQIEQIRQLGLGDTEEQALINAVKQSANAQLARLATRGRENLSLGAGFGVLSGQVFAGPSRSEQSLESIEDIIGRIERKMDTVGALT